MKTRFSLIFNNENSIRLQVQLPTEVELEKNPSDLLTINLNKILIPS